MPGSKEDHNQPKWQWRHNKGYTQKQSMNVTGIKPVEKLFLDPVHFTFPPQTLSIHCLHVPEINVKFLLLQSFRMNNSQTPRSNRETHIATASVSSHGPLRLTLSEIIPFIVLLIIFVIIPFSLNNSFYNPNLSATNHILQSQMTHLTNSSS